MTLLTFASASPPNSSNSVFHIIADNSTSASLLASIYDSYSSLFGPDPSSTAASSVPAAYKESDPSRPPEQAARYYRASSVVLTIDGYSTSATMSAAVTGGNAAEGGVADSLLPVNVDPSLLNA